MGEKGWSVNAADVPHVQQFQPGDMVAKVGGDYTFFGEVRSAFTKKSGVWRYCVENDAGILHIFNGKQLNYWKPK